MKPESAESELLRRVVGAGRTLTSLQPAEGIDLMLDFYRNERVDGCPVADDGDMLLYQWGCYDWGDGESFELDITRQLIDAGGEDEDIRQLSLTFRFVPNATLRALGDGNQWCSSPAGLSEFRSFINASAAFSAVRS